MPLSKKYLFLCLITALFLSACSQDSTSTTLSATATIEGEFIYVSTNASGILEKLQVHRGDTIAPRQPLFVLEPYPETTELAHAKTQLALAEKTLNHLLQGKQQNIQNLLQQRSEAQANLTFSKRALTRDRILYQTAGISKKTLDNALKRHQANLEKINQVDTLLSEQKLGKEKSFILQQASKVEQAKANIKQLNWEISQKTISASQKGEVFDTFFYEGEYVPAGSAVLALLTPHHIKLTFHIPKSEHNTLRINQKVAFQCDVCQGTQSATVSYISPDSEYADIQAHELMYRVEASIPQRASTLFHTGEKVIVEW